MSTVPYRPRRLRALVVDDEPLIRMCTADFLTELNFDTLEADSGQMAMDLLETNTIDLIITDYVMPGMTGTQLADTVAASNPETIVIIASGGYDVGKSETSYFVLNKPFTLADLSSVLTTSGIMQKQPNL